MTQDLRVPVDQIGRYRLQKRIGGGGMGVVYIAFHEKVPDRPVALKLLLFEEHLDRFRREAEIIRKFSHPNIISLLDFGEVKEPLDLGSGPRTGAYLVMPYLPHGSLADRLAAIKPTGAKMPLPEITRILRELTAALDYAHQQGVIHRDLKPANVLFDIEGRAVLTDFGIALPTDLPRLTATGVGVGTPQYASPEQIQGADVGPASDFYSLGVVLYEMTTNELPFRVENPLQWPNHHLHTPPRPATSFRVDLPRPAGEVIARALAKRPQDRFASGASLLQAWRAALGDVADVLDDETQIYPSAPPLRFVGREREVQTLWDGLRRTLDGRPVALMVEGEGGMGKTALVDHFLTQASGQYPELLVGRGRGLSLLDGGGTPFHPFSQIFEQVTTQLARESGEPDPDPADKKQHPPEGLRRFIRILVRSAPAALDAFLPPVAFGLKLVQAVVEETPLHERVKVPGVLSGEIEESEAPGSPRRPRILDPWQENPDVLIAQYCQAMVELSRERPMILVVDALREADDDSWRLLEQLNRHIAGQQARILLIGCYRPRDLKTETAQTTLERIKGQTLSLPVGQDEPHDFVTRFIQANYSHYQFDAEFARRLAGHTGANPRFLEATLSYLDEQGLLTLEQQRRLASQPAFDALGLPDDVTALIQTRVGDLGRRERTILQHASVQGRIFARPVLAHTLYHAPPPGWERLDEKGIGAGLGQELAEMPHLVTLNPPAPPDAPPGGRKLTYHAFRDGFTRDFLYGGGDRETLCAIHYWVGHELERLYGDRAEAIAPQLAYHFHCCQEEPWRVLHYANQVAQRLYNRYDMAAVHFWCDMALDAAEQLSAEDVQVDPISRFAPPEELEWQIRELKGDALFFQSDWEKAREQYTLLLNRLPPEPTKATALSHAVEMLRKIGETWRCEGSQAPALERFRRGLKLLEGNPLATTAQRATLHREIGYVLAQQEEAGDVEEELRHYRLAWDLVKDDPKEWALVSSLCTCLGTTYERQVEPVPGKELTSKERDLLLEALRWHSRAIRLRGELLPTDPELARDRLGLAGALSNRAIVYEKLCEWDRCEADHLRAIELFTEISHELSLAIARLNFGEMYRQRGRNSQAAEQYRGSLQVFIALGDRYGELIDHYNLSLVEDTEALREGHLLRALTLAAVDERWDRLQSYAGHHLRGYPQGAEREDVRRWLASFLTEPSAVPSYLEALAAVCSPEASADHATLVERASNSAWQEKVHAALFAAG